MYDHRQDRVDGLLRLTTTRYGRDVAVVSLSGELDASNVATANEVLHAAVLTDDALVIIDLYELEFLDSSGAALLVGLGKIPGSPERPRVLPSHSPAVRRLLDLTNLGSLVHIAGERRELAA